MENTRRDLILGIFLIFASIVLYFVTFNFKSFSDVTVGVDVKFMPRVILGLTIIVSLFIIYSSIKGRKEKVSSSDVIDETIEEEKVFEKDYKKFLYTILLTIGYIILISTLGFLISTFIYLTLQMYLMSGYLKKKLVLLVIISLISSALIYFIFRNVFYVMLPQGIL